MQTCCHLKIPQVSWSPFLFSLSFQPRLLVSRRKVDQLNADIRTIASILESQGVFDQASLLDPEAIVNVALSLAGMPNPNEYKLWLALYASRYQVSTADLATDVLIVLSHAADFVGSVISKASASQVKQLVTV
jgi:hypothetical protein